MPHDWTEGGGALPLITVHCVISKRWSGSGAEDCVMNYTGGFVGLEDSTTDW